MMHRTDPPTTPSRAQPSTHAPAHRTSGIETAGRPTGPSTGPTGPADPPDRTYPFRGGSAGSGARSLLDEHTTETQLLAFVIDLAHHTGWHTFHPYDSRRSAPGWPDLVLVRAPEIIAAELKTERGRLRPEQVQVLALLTACNLEVHVWRPSDTPAIVARLTRATTA
jgi:hypothetical protein